ncbi:uncharacterized protein F5Z01DRAFT_636264 [Emericellopsis atlantica]|uniref:Uncharacterized protein n=1 Tax=Emericellopsis atlantica TaxID=2614577 RepID=A0A9P7ZME2_9HYPO|nr:uncharacterized protein F5Z01DRAFT_636264 [Emericellopsis atlantica]KAG9254798.1 hypothetical protein F5Z01DRAFT_636264 [Emericellopsis atlantica]
MASEITNSTSPEYLFSAQNAACSVVLCSISQICLALWTISPLLAYPSLPHFDRMSGNKEFDPASLLVGVSKVKLLFHFFIALFSVSDVVSGAAVAPIPIITWPLYLSIFTLAAKCPALHFSPDNPLRPSDFHFVGHWACYSLLYVLFRAFDTIIDRKPSYAFVLAALIVFSISEWLTKHVTKHTHAYITRKISYPGWLWAGVSYWPLLFFLDRSY